MGLTHAKFLSGYMMKEMNPPGSFKQNFKCHFIASGWPSQVFFSKGMASNPEGNGEVL
jgi:hypothetical protein